MDTLTFIVGLLTPFLAFLGVILGKKMDLNKAHDTAVENCQKKHKGDIENVKAEFKEELATINDKLDEIKTEQLKTALYVVQLQNDLQDLKTLVNDILEKENETELKVAVLDNREKVSENRIHDLETEAAARNKKEG